MNILHIDSSILGANSISRQLTRDAVKRLIGDGAPSGVTYRDLVETPLQHLSGSYLQALQSAEGTHDPDVQSDLVASETALQEFVQADIVIIGAALYNFGVPSQLKAWIDRLMVPNVTFQYRPDGSVEGLMTGKRTILCVARGGFYRAGTPQAELEHVETYLRGVLTFMGVTDLAVIAADGVAVGPDHREAAMVAARAEIDRLPPAA